MKSLLWTAAFVLALSAAAFAAKEAKEAAHPKEADFDREKDLISLHYDHAPDRDDGQSAAADITILATEFEANWIQRRVVAVSGAYGKNARSFNSKSDAVMDAAFADYGGWIAAHRDHEAAVEELTKRWLATLTAGGDVWVKEGGQSDITAAVVKNIQRQAPEIDTKKRIHTVQHSNWNENQTTDAALAFARRDTDYIRIKDGNAFLNIKGGNSAFEKAAAAHPKFGPAWKAAFAYYPPRHRLDFSDTCELMHILGLGKIGVDAFRKRYLE